MLTSTILLLFSFYSVQAFPRHRFPTQAKNKQQNIGRIHYGSRPSSSQQQNQGVSTFSRRSVGGMKLELSKQNNEDEGKIPFLASALGISILLSTWPLLTFLRDVNSPTDGFDVDMFMALKGMLDNSSVGSDSSNSDMSMLTDENYRSIVELPALSPAEQLVGAVFGPPR